MTESYKRISELTSASQIAPTDILPVTVNPSTSACVIKATAQVVMNSQFNAKGDIYVASGSKSGSTLSVGTNGYMLVPDSTTERGVKWTPQVSKCYIPMTQSIALDSTMQNTITIPTDMDGWILTKVVVTAGSSTSGSPAFTVKSASSVTISGSQNMLTSNPVVGEKAFSSESGVGSVAAVINTSYRTVQAGNTIWVSPASASTTGSMVYWCGATLTFQNGV